MNLPNRLTILRVLMIPLCLALILLGHYAFAAAVFLLAALTDFLDGYLARRDKLVTNFGKFADPVADKLLVLTVMIAMLAVGRYPWWAVVIVAMRELAVDGLRLVAVEQGVVIPAGNLGKVKTNAQFISVVASLLLPASPFTLALQILMAALTLISGAQYFYGARELLKS